MKKAIPFFLLVIISLSHLNIIDSVMPLSARDKKENSKPEKAIPDNEERETEKENKGKDKTAENEKFLGKHTYNSANQHKLLVKAQFAWYNTMLNIHPYQDDEAQPPNAV